MAEYTPLPGALAPSSFYFYEEGLDQMVSPDTMKDDMAKIVLQRFRNAAMDKRNSVIYQGKTTARLLYEAEHAMRKQYTPAMQAALNETLGFCPTRYRGVAAAKAVAIANWKAELVAGDPGALVKIVPTPDPRLSKQSIEKIKEGVRAELVDRMQTSGLGPRDVLTSTNRLHEVVKRFLDEKTPQLRQVEQARIVAAANETAGRMQIKMRDVVIEGGFREAYAKFTNNQINLGIGIMRFPYWERRVVLSDSQSGKGKPTRVWKTVPTFVSVSPHNFFTTKDGTDVDHVTACLEYREISKSTLVGLIFDERYDGEQIRCLLEDFNFRNRGWLFSGFADTKSADGQSSTYWGPEEVIPVLYHEGRVTGHDLQQMGRTGVEASQIYDVRLEICGGRTIRMDVLDPLKGLPRSYATTKYEDLGDGIWNTVGVPNILHDTEQRVNILMHLVENNIDWSMRPPLQVNPDAFQRPNEALNIRPGGQYQISDQLGLGQILDPLRAIRGPTSQYQIVYPIIRQMIMEADAEVGVPDLSDMSTFGRGSLGELSARVSQAVRRVRSAAFTEDRSMKAVWRVLYEYTLDQNPQMVENADLDMNYIGVIGLLAQEQEQQAKMRRLAVVTQARDRGVAPAEVEQFAYTDMLKDLGIPTDALGMRDPLTEQAIAIATQTGNVSVGTGVPQVPQLDGRSGAMARIPSAIAQPNGASAMPGTAPQMPTPF